MNVKKKVVTFLCTGLLVTTNIVSSVAATTNENNQTMIPREEIDEETSVTGSDEIENFSDKVVAEEQKETLNPISDESIDSWMPDKNLQKIISNLLGLSIEELTPERLQSFSGHYDLELTDDTNLSGNPNQISNLQGLQYLPSVNITLDLYHLSNTKSSVDFSYFFETQSHYITIKNHNVDFTNFGLFYDYLYFDNFSEGSFDSSHFNIEDLAWDTGVYRESHVNLDLAYSSLKDFKVNVDEFYQRGEIGVGNIIDFDDENFEEHPYYSYNNLVELDYEGLDEDYNDGTFLGYASLTQSKGNTLIYAVFTDGNNLLFKWRKGELSINEPNTSLSLKGEFNHAAQSNYSALNTHQFVFITHLNININLNLTGSVEVNYLYNDLPIAEKDEIKGLINSEYSTSPLQIEGYSLDKTKGDPQGKFSDKVQTVNYIYKKNSVKAADVTTKYVDTEGNSISEDIVKSGNVGDTYSTEQKDIEGYTFKEVQGNATGQFTDQVQTVTYVYSKNKILNITGTVLVKYVDTEGNSISEDIVKSGNIGDTYSTEQKDIEGYTFKEVQGSPTGQIMEQNQTVTYVYTKEKKVVISSNSDNNKYTQSLFQDLGTNNDANKTSLPETGESKSMIVTIIGMLLLLLTGIAIAYHRKERKS